ncbi:MAG TPA: DUF362 domain-containing protein [Prolixibacteraceae bacterium]|nr:DUF362 domain-containing protein [Prolixibacteraceae bacterium]
MYQIRTKALQQLSKFKKTKTWTTFSFILLGVTSTTWFLIRVIPKPSRASYPCMKASAPFMSGFVVYLLSISISALTIKNFKKKLAASKYMAAATLFIAAFASLVIANTANQKEAHAATLLSPQSFKANAPIGVPSGFKPGRVVWVWDKDATNENFTPANNQNSWWAMQTSYAEVSKMLENAVMKYSEKATLSESWDVLFKYFNEQHGKGGVGYQAGEKIYIKLNITNSASGTKKTADFDHMDSTPELALAMLKELIEVVGVAQSDIYIGDPFRRFHNLYWDMCHSVYPNVNYCDGNGTNGRHQTVPTTEHVMVFSDKKYDFRIPQEYVDASYIINMPCLKTHNEGGITLGAKNHQGSVLQDGGTSTNQYIIDMHYSLPANNPGYKKYRHVVDYLSHKDVGGKTLITVIDGIWAGRSWEGFVEKWNMAPFNGDYPNSLFLSQDRVAVDAVCYDFLLEEYKSKPTAQQYPYYDGCDDYLYQAADSTYWPEGIKYDPEGDGITIKSLGVYEHWDNATDKKYSKNLGTGNGIELVKITLNNTPFTPDNSGIASEKVNKIFVDSFDVKWFGTDKGISRYDGKNWTTIDKSNYLRDNTVNDIQYEKTKSGNEIWVATNGGLSVMSYNVDGITAATTYYVGGTESGIINDTVTAVGVDVNHVKWASTPQGISILGNKGWKSTTSFTNGMMDTEEWNRLHVNDIASYNNDSMIYMATSGKNVIRYKYNDVDGFTGATSFSDWCQFASDTIYSISIYDTIQWYGTSEGASVHYGSLLKSYWDHETAYGDYLVNRVVKDVEKDDAGNIWIGTQKGINFITEEGILRTGTSVQVSDIKAINSGTSATLSWTNGNGLNKALTNENVNDLQKDRSGNMWIATDKGVESRNYTNKRIVFVTQANSGTVAPVDETIYTANSEFKKGTAIGEWYCVYNGSGNSVEITGLTVNKTYRVMAFEYYGDPGKEKYTLDKGYNNPINFTSWPVSAEKVNSNKINIYPIPFNDYLVVHFNEMNTIYHATICTIDGKIMKQEQLYGNNQQINSSSLAKGIYLLKLSDGKNENILKIIK